MNCSDRPTAPSKLPTGFGWIVAALAAVWVVASKIIVPLTVIRIEALYAWVASHGPVPYYLGRWNTVANAGLSAIVLIYVITRWFATDGFAHRFLGTSTARGLAAIRILTAGILLGSTAWEDLDSTALLPDGMRTPLGVLAAVEQLVPGFTAFVHNPVALQSFQAFTALTLALALIGLGTRVVVPLGAFGYLVMAGILREYAWFYHTGLVPLYVLIVLSFTPCGDAWSVDSAIAARRGQGSVARSPMTYAWSRYAVWTVIALAYFAAGLSKIRNGGLFWWNATNMRGILYMDSLNPMEFDWRVSLYLADTPDAFFAALGLAAVLGELGYIGVLFSQRLRVLLTTAMALMHLGIWFLQNVLFFDLILLQLVFFDLDRPVSRVMRTLNLGRSHIDTTAITPPSRARWLSAPVGLALLVGVMFTSWFLRIEYYPLTGMQMYTPADNSGVVSYYRVIAHPRSGAVERAPIEEAVGAMADGRYRKIARQCFDEKTGDLCRAFMHAAAGAYNRSAAPAEQLVALEAQKWQWNFREHPDDAQHGTLVDRVVIPVGPSPR